MNTQILQKCLSELDKSEPRIDYVRGMLETLVSLHEDAPPNKPKADKQQGYHPDKQAAEMLDNGFSTNKEEEADDGIILDAKARANIDKVRKWAAEGLDTP